MKAFGRCDYGVYMSCSHVQSHGRNGALNHAFRLAPEPDTRGVTCTPAAIGNLRQCRLRSPQFGASLETQVDLGQLIDAVDLC